MQTFFKDYSEAHTAAINLARQLGKEVGLEKFKEFNTKGFRIFHLPKPENRHGFELRCEVVKPSDPL